MELVDGLPEIFKPVCDGCFDYLLSQKKELIEVFEKAGKWNAFCQCLNWLNDPPVEILLRQFHALNMGNQDKRKKLEAVKTHRENFRHSSYIEWLRELDKILEGETLQNIGDKAR